MMHPFITKLHPLLLVAAIRPADVASPTSFGRLGYLRAEHRKHAVGAFRPTDELRANQ